MTDFTLIMEQYLFISVLLSLLIIFYHLPTIATYFNQTPLYTQQKVTLSTKIVIKRFSTTPSVQVTVFFIRRLKIKYKVSDDLEDCYPLL